MQVLRVLAVLLAMGPLATGAPNAQTAAREQAKPFSHQAARERANENLLMLLGGTLGGPYIQLAQDIAMTVNDKDNMRVLPIAGDGAVGNVRDILLLRGVDLGVTSVQVLNGLKASGEYGPNLERRIAYIAQLSVDTFHVLARPGINSLKDLHGKKVNVLQKGSGTSVFGPRILKPLGVQVVEVHATHNDGVQLMRTGEIDGALCVCPIPVPAYAAVKPESGFRLLEVPYIPAFEESYLPASLTSEKYANLIAEGSKVETIGTSTVLIAFNWTPGTERYKKIEKFVSAFFSNMDKLRQSPRHPVWKDVNIAASIRGWQRFPAAQQWLDRQAAEAKAKAPPPGDTSQTRTQTAKGAPFEKAEQERLFREFMEWSRTRAKR